MASKKLPKTLTEAEVAALCVRCNLATPTGLRDRR
jgi:site-specific recombinase XerD